MEPHTNDMGAHPNDPGAHSNDIEATFILAKLGSQLLAEKFKLPARLIYVIFL